MTLADVTRPGEAQASGPFSDLAHGRAGSCGFLDSLMRSPQTERVQLDQGNPAGPGFNSSTWEHQADRLSTTRRTSSRQETLHTIRRLV